MTTVGLRVYKSLLESELPCISLSFHKDDDIEGLHLFYCFRASYSKLDCSNMILKRPLNILPNTRTTYSSNRMIKLSIRSPYTTDPLTIYLEDSISGVTDPKMSRSLISKSTSKTINDLDEYQTIAISTEFMPWYKISTRQLLFSLARDYPGLCVVLKENIPHLLILIINSRRFVLSIIDCSSKEIQNKRVDGSILMMITNNTKFELINISGFDLLTDQLNIIYLQYDSDELTMDSIYNRLNEQMLAIFGCFATRFGLSMYSVSYGPSSSVSLLKTNPKIYQFCISNSPEIVLSNGSLTSPITKWVLLAQLLANNQNLKQLFLPIRMPPMLSNYKSNSNIVEAIFSNSPSNNKYIEEVLPTRPLLMEPSILIIIGSLEVFKESLPAILSILGSTSTRYMACDTEFLLHRSDINVQTVQFSSIKLNIIFLAEGLLCVREFVKLITTLYSIVLLFWDRDGDVKVLASLDVIFEYKYIDVQNQLSELPIFGFKNKVGLNTAANYYLLGSKHKTTTSIFKLPGPNCIKLNQIKYSILDSILTLQIFIKHNYDINLRIELSTVLVDNRITITT